MPDWTLEFKPSAYKAFARLDPAIKRRLTPALEGLLRDPRPPGATRLSGASEFWRIRVGAYRIVYTIEDDRLVVVVVRLGPRGSVYRGL